MILFLFFSFFFSSVSLALAFHLGGGHEAVVCRSRLEDHLDALWADGNAVDMVVAHENARRRVLNVETLQNAGDVEEELRLRQHKPRA